ncbi:MAG: transcriptional regulator [Thermoprotei archaeon]|mgnify:CR=1 FL=1|nr:MAG: transcriptional regulator [Thermoprotei archaeon]RLF00154.1 MAG: transcriptional regulator [Thermoprotei archaeon]HDI75001.1 Zn-ribbon domain-containing OB-fold protein [Thermoprotei archaeon]
MSVPRYWRERVTKYRLIGAQCTNCGKSFYPPRKVCPYCGSRDLKEVALPRKGKVISFTVIRVPPAGFELYSPYLIAIVELENGTRVLAQLTDVDLSEVKVGMPVEATFRKYLEHGPSGIIEYGIKFRPVIKGEDK